MSNSKVKDSEPISSWPPDESNCELLSSWPPEETNCEPPESGCEPLSSWPPEPDCEPLSSWPPPISPSSEEVSNMGLSESRLDNSTISVGKKLKLDFEESDARVALAVWFRKHQRLLNFDLPTTISARSKINYISSTPEGRKFLADKHRDLKSLEDKFSHSPEYHYVCATYADLLGLKENAADSCRKSLELSGKDPLFIEICSLKDYLAKLDKLTETEKDSYWLLGKLNYEKQLKDNSIKINNQKLDEGKDNEISEMDACKKGKLEVTKVRAENLSLQDFQTQYCSKRKAVIITDAESPTEVPWDLNHIRSKCGDRTVTIKSPSQYSSEWARLEETETKKLSAFIDQKIDDHYLFDWSLPLNAPDLAAEFRIPKYFQQNFLTKTEPGAMYRESWPSLFLGPKGTRSGLHIDAFGSHFWMYLISGVKRWTFYPAESAGELNPVFYDSMDPVFYPSEEVLRNTECFSVDLQPGELLFVPAGSPHQVENLEDTIAVSGNFVNESNAEEFVRHLKVNSLQDPRSKDLLLELFNLNLIT